LEADWFRTPDFVTLGNSKAPFRFSPIKCGPIHQAGTAVQERCSYVLKHIVAVLEAANVIGDAHVRSGLSKSERELQKQVLPRQQLVGLHEVVARLYPLKIRTGFVSERALSKVKPAREAKTIPARKMQHCVFIAPGHG